MTLKSPESFPSSPNIFHTRLSDGRSPNPAVPLALFSRSPWGEGRTNMSQISRGILGAIAISLAFGAASFAAGHDLTGTLARSPGDTAGTLATDINRAA